MPHAIIAKCELLEHVHNYSLSFLVDVTIAESNIFETMDENLHLKLSNDGKEESTLEEEGDKNAMPCDILSKIREDFEIMSSVKKYHERVSKGYPNAELYPGGYSKAQKRALRRYAVKYELEG